MTSISHQTAAGEVSGFCDPEFTEVLEAFIRNFDERGETGASVCIHVDGEKKVDLWGGVADPKTGLPWEKDTISIVFSCTKAATALCAHLLIDRGELELDAPVSRYWPEYAQKDKEKTTVRMMLNHSAGVPAFRKPIRKGGYADWDYMVNRLEAEEPFWEPGTRNGYHMISFGWTVGELVRRVSGKSLGTFFRENIAEPLKLDFWIGLPPELEDRVAPITLFKYNPGDPLSDFMKTLLHRPDSITALALLNSGRFDINDPLYHAAEIGGAAGITNARGLSGMYLPLSCNGTIQGLKFISPDAVTRMSLVSSATQYDMSLLAPTRFALGFMKSMDNRFRNSGNESLILGDRAFGHGGAGGSLGFADPDCRLAFGYTMNRQGEGIMINPRGQSLVDSCYRSLGYRSNISGVWAR